MIAGRDYLVPLEFDAERDRDAWLAERVRGHGGSDVAKILGEHPTKGPIDVWLSHTGGAVDDGDNERTRRGRFLEPYVLRWFAEGGDSWPRAGGPLVVLKPPTVYHRDRPWQRGSADGLVYGPEMLGLGGDDAPAWGAGMPIAVVPDSLLEIKTHGWFGSRGYSLDDEDNPLISVPPDKRIQCAWYMALYGVGVTYLAAVVDTHLFRTFAIPRDLDLEAMLLEEVDEFRRKYILTGEPPPPDGKASYRDYLRTRFKTHSADLVDSTDEVDQAVEDLIALKSDMKRLKSESELAEQKIKQLIADNSGVRTAHGIVTWKVQRSGKYRDKEMRAELYKVAGWTDVEIAEFEARFEQPDHRVLRTPK